MAALRPPPGNRAAVERGRWIRQTEPMAANTRQPDPSALFLDRSRRRIEEDELGRKGFVRSVWHALRNHDASEAIVISIQAPWGDGKTTLKDMVVTLEETEGKREKLLFVHFNPWEWAAQNQVATAFFGELAKQIEECIGKGVGKRVREALGKTVRALPHFFGLFEAGSQGAAMATAPTSPPLAILAAAGAELAKKGRELSEQVVNHQTGLSAIDTPSVQLVKISVRKQFEEFKKKTHRNIVVFIDDIDRLSADEIRQVLQLVKVNADFPGLIFVLLYDKAYVERRLRRHFGNDAGSFLEKIVQVELHVPPAAQNQLYAIFESRVAGVLENRLAYRALYEESRLKEAFDAWFRIHLTNPRKFGRLLSSWAFRLDVFDSKTAEVNPVDLLILEGLSLYEPKLYRKLSGAYGELFPGPYESMVEGFMRNQDRKPGGPSARMQALNRIAQKTDGDWQAVAAVLKILLGVTDNDFATPPPKEQAIRVKALRFSNSRFFRRYFRLAIDSGDVSNATIRRLLRLTHSADEFTDSLTRLESEGVLLDALEQLLAHETGWPTDPTQLLARVLDWWEPRIVGVAPSGLSERLFRLYEHLVGDRDGDDRWRILRDSVQKSEAVHAVRDVAFRESYKIHHNQDAGSLAFSAVLRPEQDRALREIAAERLLRSLQSTPPMARPCEVEACFWAWDHGEGHRPDIARELLKSPGGTLTLLFGTLGRCVDSNHPDELRAIPGLLERFIPYVEFLERVDSMRPELLAFDSQGASGMLEKLDQVRGANSGIPSQRPP